MAKYYHPSYSRFFTTDNGGVYNSRTGRELGNKPNKNGFVRISIRPRGSNPISLLKHKFIWEAFNNEETDKFFRILHVDGDKQNNRPDNLKRVLNESSNPEGQTEKYWQLICQQMKKDFLTQYTRLLKHFRLTLDLLN